MHLLQAGVPLEVIVLWLGHEQPAVTHTYVQADIKMKQECMKLLEQPSKPRRKRDPMRFSRLLSFLEAQKLSQVPNKQQPSFSTLGCCQLGIIQHSA